MRPKVLFVDDDVSRFTVIKRNIEHEFDFQVVSSGARALELLASERDFAVIVTDMRMPEMDGFQLIKQARQHSPDTLFIMLTGSQDSGTVIDASDRGSVFRFLVKPCSFEEVRCAVAAASRRYQIVHPERQLRSSWAAAGVV